MSCSPSSNSKVETAKAPRCARMVMEGTEVFLTSNDAVQFVDTYIRRSELLPTGAEGRWTIMGKTGIRTVLINHPFRNQDGMEFPASDKTPYQVPRRSNDRWERLTLDNVNCPPNLKTLPLVRPIF